MRDFFEVFVFGIFLIEDFVFRVISGNAAKAIMGIKNIFAVFEILAVPADAAKIAIEEGYSAVAHIAKFRAEARIVKIHRIFHADAVVNVHGIFLVAYVKTVKGVFRVENMIAKNMFIVEALHGGARHFGLQFKKFLRRV